MRELTPDSKTSSLFFNREISWLNFNTRVLNIAKDSSLPLLERLKFLSIYSTNLDEFYMIRIAGLERLYANGITKTSPDGLSVKDQLHIIKSYIQKEQNTLEETYLEIITKLKTEGLIITDFSTLDSVKKLKMQEYFKIFIYPVIVPILIDSSHPFPHLNNLSFAIALELRNQENKEIKYAIVHIPRVLKRFIEVESGLFVTIESLIGEFAKDLFLGFEVLDFIAFRITRNADIEIEEHEADDFIALMNEGLKARKKGCVVRLEFSSKTQKPRLQNFIQNQINAKLDHWIYFYTTILNMGSLLEIINNKQFAHLITPPFNAKMTYDAKEDLFEVIKKQDILLFQPYESFEMVVNFIHQASLDPKVLSIRMTLYRVGSESPIVKSLIRAAEKKQVTVFVELKARFDEENNLHWAKALEDAGAHVIYGIPGLKVHAKIALVIRQEKQKLQGYVHLSTGNYNPISAKIYTDLSYFTSDHKICNDAISFFHSLSIGNSHKTTLQSLLMAPTQIKPKLLELIKQETQHGTEGKITLKANALIDPDIIQALYEASQAGVCISLLIRGICTLVPQVKGMSENIRVFSLVGKYLEHARIYHFKHSPDVFFSSADLMPRNLDRRIELLVAIKKENAKKLTDILEYQLRDTSLYELHSNGEYIPINQHSHDFRAQIFFEELYGKND